MGGGAEYFGIYISSDWVQVLLAFRSPTLASHPSLPFSCWKARALPSHLLFWACLANPSKLRNLTFTGSPSDRWLVWGSLLQVELRLELLILLLEVLYLLAEWLDDCLDELENLFLLHASYY